MSTTFFQEACLLIVSFLGDMFAYSVIFRRHVCLQCHFQEACLLIVSFLLSPFLQCSPSQESWDMFTQLGVLGYVHRARSPGKRRFCDTVLLVRLVKIATSKIGYSKIGYRKIGTSKNDGRKDYKMSWHNQEKVLFLFFT